jgi:nucleotide-binding universal stress UspA family protein
MMKSANDLVIERPVAAIDSTASSPIKSILFGVHDDDELDSRLQAALSLARSCSAHLHLLQVVPLEAYTVVDTYGGTFVSGAVVEALEEQAAKVRIRLEAQLEKEDVSWDFEDLTSATIPELLQNAAFADILFIGRQPPFREFSRTGPGLLGALVCTARTPLCIPGDGSTRFDPFGKAVIAWNGSAECANAVRSTIGLLKMASGVRVVRFTENKELRLSDERLLEYLSRHDVHAEMDTHLPRTDIASDLLEYASRAGAEYIVMGGYSHSRAGEFLFGGVTRELLGSCPISLVMAH